MSLVAAQVGAKTLSKVIDDFVNIATKGVKAPVRVPGQVIISTGQGVRTATPSSTFGQIGRGIRNFITSNKGQVATQAGIGGATVAATRTGITAGTKATAAVIAASTAATVGIPLLTLTPGGQSLAEQPAKITEQITKFFTENPLATVAIVLVGGALLIGAVKSK